MIVGLGLDVVEIDRIAGALEQFGDRFIHRILTDLERKQMRGDTIRYLAVRFAAKEAAAKALGTGLAQGVTFHSIEVDRQRSGKPDLRLLAGAAEVARELGVVNAHISLTHGRDIASAVVVLENE